MSLEQKLFNYERMRGKSWIFLFYAFLYAFAAVAVVMLFALIAFNFSDFMAGTMENVSNVEYYLVLSLPLSIPFFIYFKRKIFETKWLGLAMGTFLTIYLSVLIVLNMITLSPNLVTGIGLGSFLALAFAYLSYIYHYNALQELKLW